MEIEGTPYFFQTFVVSSPEQYVKIVRYDLSQIQEDGTFPESAKVASEPTLELYHANDVTYNSKINRLIVCHGSAHYKFLSMIDPISLEITETIEIAYNVGSIQYNEKRDCYVTLPPGEHYIRILDADFNLVTEYTDEEANPIVVTTATQAQGVYCDNNYIYYLCYDSTNKFTAPENTQVHAISVFDWDGNRIKEIAFSIPISDMKNEPESINLVGNTFYIEFNVPPGANNSKYSGNYLYTFELENN